MTDDNMDLRSVLEKTSDADFLREMIGFGAQRLMELEVESLTGEVDMTDGRRLSGHGNFGNAAAIGERASALTFLKTRAGTFPGERAREVPLRRRSP